MAVRQSDGVGGGGRQVTGSGNGVMFLSFNCRNTFRKQVDNIDTDTDPERLISPGSYFKPKLWDVGRCLTHCKSHNALEHNIHLTSHWEYNFFSGKFHIFKNWIIIFRIKA